TARPVGHLAQALGAERRGAVDEDDHRIRTATGVQWKLLVTVAGLPGVVGVGDLALLGGREPLSDIVDQGLLTPVTSDFRGVPNLRRHSANVQRARADGPWPSRRWVFGYLEDRGTAALHFRRQRDLAAAPTVSAIPPASAGGTAAPGGAATAGAP